MSATVQQLKNRFTSDINALKEKVIEIQEVANAKKAMIKSKVETKQNEVQSSFHQAQEKVVFQRHAVKESVKDFKHNRTTKYAERRAERSEDYALACIALARESVLEAELAILEAIDTSVEADLLKTNLK